MMINKTLKISLLFLLVSTCFLACKKEQVDMQPIQLEDALIMSFFENENGDQIFGIHQHAFYVKRDGKGKLYNQYYNNILDNFEVVPYYEGKYAYSTNISIDGHNWFNIDLSKYQVKQNPNRMDSIPIPWDSRVLQYDKNWKGMIFKGRNLSGTLSLYRYNGEQLFEVPTQLQYDDFYTLMAMDQNQRLWLGGDNLRMVDGSTDSIIANQVGQVTNLKIDDQDKVWGLAGAALFYVQNGAMVKLDTSNSNVSVQTFSYFHIDSQNVLWLCDGINVYSYDPSLDKFETHYSFVSNSILITGKTFKGVYVLNTVDHKVYKLINKELINISI
jgi:hypothetical protein